MKERRRVEDSLLYSMAFTFGSSSSQPSTGFGANAGQGKAKFVGLRDDQAEPHLFGNSDHWIRYDTSNHKHCSRHSFWSRNHQQHISRNIVWCEYRQCGNFNNTFWHNKQHNQRSRHTLWRHCNISCTRKHLWIWKYQYIYSSNIISTSTRYFITLYTRECNEFIDIWVYRIIIIWFRRYQS